jgi:hypothetical protein
MKARILLLVLAGLMAGGIGLLAQPQPVDEPAPLPKPVVPITQASPSEPAPAVPKLPQAVPDDPRIRQLIADLQDSRFRVREEATAQLLRIGIPACGPLRKALEAKPDLELTRRIESVLWELEFDEQNTPVVNGLKICLNADRKKIKPGETVTFTTRVCNVTDKDINLKVGYSYCGNYFEQGFAFRRFEEPHREVKAECHFGFCGTGAYPLFVTIPAKATVEYKTVARFGTHERCYMGYQLGHNTLDGLAGWTHRFRVHQAVTAPENEDRGRRRGAEEGNDGRPTNEKAPYWSGSIYSNEVRISAQQ